MSHFNESAVEEAALYWLRELGYTTVHGEFIAPDTPNAERVSYGEVVLVERLRAALQSLNPNCPPDVLEEAIRKLTRAEHPSLVEENRRIHRFLLEGVPVEYTAQDGRTVHDHVQLIDYETLTNNDWLAVNQFTVIENRSNRRPDIVVFVNGLPLGTLELKNPGDEHATLRGAFNQLQTYKHDIPSLFPYNAALVISDGVGARIGALTSDWERFMPWRTVQGDALAPDIAPQLEVLIKGVFEQRRFLDLIRFYTVFEVDGAQVFKKMAAYHQFHAVEKAVTRTVEAEGGRVGVIWHTQGSGKSLTMAFYAGRLIQRREMANPTLVVITDRNDLDEQLFGTFAACKDLLRQTPVQAEDREHLKELLRVASGGVVFTTIQKFLPERGERYPLLSERDNIVVIADEAHRTQYDLVDGFARNVRDALPHARFIAFTGTPIDTADRSTERVFGDIFDVYDIQQSVEDGATVPIYYEARWAKLDLDPIERPQIDPDFEEVTEGEEDERREQLKSKWSRMEALAGSERRVALLAQDIVDHFERRLDLMDGKGMIVCMSRRICVDLYNAIVALRPDWHDKDDEIGAIMVVMTGSAADPLDWQPHIRNKARREALAIRLKDPDDPLTLVIVRDMWLTGFDAPSLHTMYVDKPMRGHGLMQAIARVNRVFKDKPGGLVVDYLGLADQLKEALTHYTDQDRKNTGIPEGEAIAVLEEKYHAVVAFFDGFDYSRFFTGTPAEQLTIIPAAMEHILLLPNGKTDFMLAVQELSKAFALAGAYDGVPDIYREVKLFQTLRASFAKNTRSVDTKAGEDLDIEVNRIISRAVTSDQIVDLFAAMGLQRPDIAILSDEFLAQIQHVPQRNLALEMLHKLLNDEIALHARRNVVQARSFADMLEQTVRQYQNRSVELTQVIAALIDIAQQLREARERGEALGLTPDELAFYDALAAQEDAAQVLGDETLRSIAQEVVKSIRQNVSIDWTRRESVRARLRAAVKRVLRQYGFPQEKQDEVTIIILEQAEVIARDWAA